MTVKFVVRAGKAGRRSDFAQALLDSVMPALTEAAERFGEKAIDNVIAKVNSTAKPSGSRTRANPSTPLASRSSYQADVITFRYGPRITLRASGSGDFMAKFFSQNYGSGSYTIRSGGKLSIDPSTLRGGLRNPRLMNRRGKVVVDSVNHPGVSARNFWEDGIEEALDEFADLFPN